MFPVERLLLSDYHVKPLQHICIEIKYFVLMVVIFDQGFTVAIVCVTLYGRALGNICFCKGTDCYPFKIIDNLHLQVLRPTFIVLGYCNHDTRFACTASTFAALFSSTEVRIVQFYNPRKQIITVSLTHSLAYTVQQIPCGLVWELQHPPYHSGKYKLRCLLYTSDAADDLLCV